ARPAQLLHGVEQLVRAQRLCRAGEPDREPRPLGGQRTGEDAELVGPAASFFQRRLTALSARVELPLAVLQRGDLVPQALLAAVQVIEDANQVLLTRRGERRVGLAAAELHHETEPQQTDE